MTSEAVDSRTNAPEISAPRWVKIAGLISLIVSLLIYIFRIDRVVGMLVDDGWYLMLAKALATGQGYTLINSPTPGILPLYPPGYPFILSLFYRIYPQFPENVAFLKFASIIAMFIVGVIVYRYFLFDRRLPAWIALGIALATVICPPLVFLAVSSLMSDCVFMLFLTLTIYLIERCLRARGTSWEWRFAVAAGLTASYCFFTRSIALAVVGVAFLYLLKEKLWRSAIIYGLIVGFLVGPWIIYTKLHQPTPEQRAEQGGYITTPYTEQFWQKLAGDSTSGDNTVGDLPKRIYNNTLEIFGRDVARILMTVIFEALRDPTEEARKVLEQQATGESKHGQILPITLILGLFVIIGFFFTAIKKLTFAEVACGTMFVVIVLWPFETIRYVLPMAPFVIFYFLMGVRAIQLLIQRRASDAMTPSGLQSGWVVAGSLLGIIIAINLYGNLLGVRAALMSSSLEGPLWTRKFEEVEKLNSRLKQVASKNDVVVSTNPALVYMYTDLKSVSWDNPDLRWELWKKLSVRYLTWTAFYPHPIEPPEAKFNTIYMSRDGSLFRIVDFGPPESRPSWGAAPPTSQ